MKKRTLLIGLMALGFLAGCGGTETSTPVGNTSTPAGSTATSTSTKPSTSKHEHTWDAGTVTKEPGCTKKGEKTYKCTDPSCTQTKKEDIAALGHQVAANATWESDATGHWHKCTRPNCDTDGKADFAEHSFKEIEKIGLLHKEGCDCGTQGEAYRVDVAEATGWNKADTKMNGKTAPNNKSTWNVEGLPAGTYSVELNVLMSYASHGERYWYNQHETDTASQPDRASEDPWRYWIAADNGEAIYPTTKKTWAEDGLEGSDQNGAFHYVQIIDSVDLKGVKELHLVHGNIGYSLIISNVRLVLKEKDLNWTPSEGGNTGGDTSPSTTEPETPVVHEHNFVETTDEAGDFNVVAACECGLTKLTTPSKQPVGSDNKWIKGESAEYALNIGEAVEGAKLYLDAKVTSNLDKTLYVDKTISNGDAAEAADENQGKMRLLVSVNDGEPAAITDKTYRDLGLNQGGLVTFELCSIDLAKGENTIKITAQFGYRLELGGNVTVEVPHYTKYVHEHNFVAGEKVNDYTPVTCKCGLTGYELAHTGKKVKEDKSWDITGVEAGTYEVYLEGHASTGNGGAEITSRYAFKVGNGAQVDITESITYSGMGWEAGDNSEFKFSTISVATVVVGSEDASFSMLWTGSGYSAFIKTVRLVKVA